jgi:inner membrane protein
LPTLIGHAAAALALGVACESERWPRRAYLAGAVCSILPDLDVIGLRLGIPYGSLLGHRGLSHSLLAAGILGLLALSLAFRRKDWTVALGAYLILATASHGLLDGLTSGGRGVAFFAPFDGARHFLPWRPIRVSPLTLHSARLWAVLASEMRWILAPAVVFSLLALGAKRRYVTCRSPLPEKDDRDPRPDTL